MEQFSEVRRNLSSRGARQDTERKSNKMWGKYICSNSVVDERKKASEEVENLVIMKTYDAVS